MSKQRIRVLWVAKGLGRGGAEVLLLQALRHLDQARFEVEIAYVLPWKDALLRDVSDLGVRTHCLGRGSLGRVFWPIRLALLLRRGGYDIVHTHMPQPAVAARLTASRHTVLLHTEHNVWPRYRRLTGFANTLTYGRNKAVIAVSEGVADSIHRPRWMPIGRLPSVHVIVHGLDTGRVKFGLDARRHARSTLGVPDDAVVLGTVGNFTPKKDHDTLLAATALLRRTFPSLRLVLIGAGPLERHLHERVRDLGLTGVATFAGSRDDVPEMLAAFDVFAMSSLYEGLSIALLEAMAAGVPCVSTRVGGVPEILVDGEEGHLVEASNPKALADAIATLLHDPLARARMGAAGQRQAASLDAGAATDRIADIYEQLVATA